MPVAIFQSKRWCIHIACLIRKIVQSIKIISFNTLGCMIISSICTHRRGAQQGWAKLEFVDWLCDTLKLSHCEALNEKNVSERDHSARSPAHSENTDTHSHVCICQKIHTHSGSHLFYCTSQIFTQFEFPSLPTSPSLLLLSLDDDMMRPLAALLLCQEKMSMCVWENSKHERILWIMVFAWKDWQLKSLNFMLFYLHFIYN